MKAWRALEPQSAERPASGGSGGRVMFQFSADPTIRPLIEVKQPAKPPPAPHGARPVGHRRARDQSIVETLMIPLAVIVLDELRDCLPEVPLTDWNDAIETFFFDRPHESLGVGVHGTRLRYCQRPDDLLAVLSRLNDARGVPWIIREVAHAQT